MACYEPRLLTSKTAKRHADIWLLKHDLEQALDCCRALIERKSELQTTVGKALLDSALIRYRRCFNRGVRIRLTSLLAELSEAEKAIHEHVICLANNHIAHSENDYELAVATIHIAPEEQPLVRGWIGAQISQMTPLSMAQLTAFASLIKKVAVGLGRMSHKTLARLEAEVDAMTDNELLELQFACIAGGPRKVSGPRTYPPPVLTNDKDGA